MAQTANKKDTGTTIKKTTTNKDVSKKPIKQEETNNKTIEKKQNISSLPKKSRVSKGTKALLKKEIVKGRNYLIREEQVPTLQSFFLFVPKRTINNGKNNMDQEDLGTTYMDEVYSVVENIMIQKLLSNNQTAGNVMFYMKAVFKYSDRPEITGDTYQIKLDLGNEGPNQLKKKGDK